MAKEKTEKKAEKKTVKTIETPPAITDEYLTKRLEQRCK